MPSSPSSWLNRLPVELFHLLFSYFFAHEILVSFIDVSDYINGVLLSYSDYRLNFQRIARGQFDLIWSRLRPDQVTSLLLSHESPASELFSTRFRLEQFTQLRSLTLVSIHFEHVRSLFANLHQLEHLRSFSFHVASMQHRYPAWNGDYRAESRSLNQFIHRKYAKVLPRLTRLSLSNTPALHDIPLPYLRHLTVSQCSTHQLDTILRQAPALQSLAVSLFSNTWHADLDLSSNVLIHLDLKTTGRSKED